MADGEYMRLGCISAGCEEKHKAKGLCQTHYLQMRRGTLGRDSKRKCAHCGDEFDVLVATQIYCARACKVAACKGKAPISRRLLLSVKQERAEDKFRKEQEAIAARMVKRHEASRRVAESLLLSKPRRQCLVCGLLIEYVFGRPRMYCSESCVRHSETYRSQRRVHKLKRKSIERGCKEARSLDPTQIFDRDKWRCQLCLRRTPKRLRGTTNMRAPELDHIVTIADGGAHRPENVQCACRRCNQIKGRKSLGQLHLL